MRLLEHESKELLSRLGIEVPRGRLLRQVEQTSEETPCVIKAQVPASDRLRQGGIRFAHSAVEVSDEIKKLLSARVAGHIVNFVLVEELIEFEAAYYLGATTRLGSKSPIVILGTEGGTGVEQTPRQTTFMSEFSPSEVFPAYQAWELLSQVNPPRAHCAPLADVLVRLVNGFLRFDATLLEINPLAITSSGRPVALDCHCEIDEAALWRQPDFAKLDTSVDRGARPHTKLEELADQVSKSEHRGVAGNVVEFDGDLSLVMGGGGASLVIFDAVRKFGGAPANYCEVGGNPSVKKVAALTRLLVSLPRSKGLAVIMNVLNNTRVDLLARGIIKGVLDAGKDPPSTILVFRAPGAWENEGYRILTKYGVSFLDRRTSLLSAAELAVRKIKEMNGKWES
jgi:succinyl-CoA synthetase beta subunit/citryl-CoA synthetase large subunit